MERALQKVIGAWRMAEQTDGKGEYTLDPALSDINIALSFTIMLSNKFPFFLVFFKPV